MVFKKAPFLNREERLPLAIGKREANREEERGKRRER